MRGDCGGVRATGQWVWGPGFRVPGFQGFRVSGFQGFRVSGFQGSRASGFQGFRVWGARVQVMVLLARKYKSVNTVVYKRLAILEFCVPSDCITVINNYVWLGTHSASQAGGGKSSTLSHKLVRLQVHMFHH